MEKSFLVSLKFVLKMSPPPAYLGASIKRLKCDRELKLFPYCEPDILLHIKYAMITNNIVKPIVNYLH